MTKGSTRNTASPNYPVAPNQYTRQFMDQFINVTRLNSNLFANSINAPKVFGSYYSDVQQNNASATAVNLMTVNNVVAAFNTVTRAPFSRIYVAETGIYNIQFSAQFDKTAAAAANIYIWLRQNGIDVPYSAGKVVLQGSVAEIVPAWNYVLLMSANDYFEIAWASTDTNVHVSAAAPVTGPPAVPGVPSVILTVCWVSNIPAQV
jgi:hypothetical protein